MGRMIVIEGVDGSGKSTQFARLCRRLEEEGVPFRQVAFPRYGQPSAALIEQYLQGQFGDKPEDVGPYAASAFFAVDRVASFQQDWGEYYRQGGLMLCDRYTTSNAVYQASKLPPEQAEPFLRWLFDFEYQKLGLPEPSLVFFLDMPEQISLELLRRRPGGLGDIHEKDREYLARCRQSALRICQLYGWRRIDCAPEGYPAPVEQVHGWIWDQVQKFLAQDPGNP